MVSVKALEGTFWQYGQVNSSDWTKLTESTKLDKNKVVRLNLSSSAKLGIAY